MKGFFLTFSIIMATFMNVFCQTSTIYAFEGALPSDTVNCMAMDAEGNILIGTANGLVSYDGFSFNVITTANGLAGNTINDISVAPNGRIYVATSNGVSVSNGNSWQNDMTGGEIRKIAGRSDGKFWYSTTHNSVIEYYAENTTPVTDDYGFSNGVTGIYIDRSQNVWISCNGNLVELCANGKTKQFPDIFSGKIVYAVYQRLNGDLIAATSNGIMSYDYNSWTALDGIEGGVAAVCEDYAQNIIYGNLNGIYRYDGTSSTLLNGSFSTGVLMVSGPTSKRIWANDVQNGIAVLDFDGNAETFHTNRTLINHTPNFIWGDNAGKVCIAGNRGINIVSDFTWLSYKKNLQNLTVKSACIHNDTLWIGTNNSLIRKAGRNISVVSQTNINALSEDASAVYAATNSGILKIVGGQVTDTIESSNTVTDMVCADGLFAIAGNAIYKIENGTMVQVPTSATITADSRFVKTASGNIFITIGSGIARLNPSESPATELIDPGLPQSIVSSAACDNNVYVLLSNGDIYEYSTSWNQITTGNYTDIASAGNGTLWAICDNGNVARICIDCNTTFTITSQPETCDGSHNASLNASATGATSYSIDNGETWQTSGTFSNISGGYKHILAKNSAGKIIADSVFFVEYGNALYNQALTYVQPDCFGETGSLILSDLGTSTFVWEDNNTSATERTNLGAGTYAVTITSGTCTRILTTTIVAKEQILPNATSDNLLCNGDNTGRIALNVSGGTSPYTYTWNNNAETAIIENLAAGEYSCTVTDRNSCTVSQSFTITQPDSLLVQTEVTNLSCWNSDDGAISVSVTGGTQPYSYLWNDGVTTADRTNLYAVTYGLMVTDANGCNVATFPTVWHPDPITFWVTNQTDITCFGANDGTISTGIRGGTRPYSYTWSDEATTANRTDLSAGYYRLTVTDANSCVATLSANVTEPDELVAVANVSPIICAGDVAQLSASATGGTGVYAQYFWFREENTTSPVCVQPNYQNVAPGTYYLVAKDSHNCTDTIQVVVEDAESHNFAVSVTNATCNGASNGAIAITAEGENIGDFAFAWSNSISSNNNANSLEAGNYSVTITDANNCTTVIDTVVSEPEVQQAGNLGDIMICEGSEFLFDVGSHASYQWSTGATTQSISISEEGTYSVTVTDNQNCHSYYVANISYRHPYTGDKLAMASVTETNSVILRWNKTENQGTAQYRIYRDSGEGFSQLASVNFDAEPMYEDTTASTSEIYYKYKVTTVSNCGDESETDDFHRTIILAAICDPNNVCNLNWSPYMGITETFTYILAGNSPETLEVVDSVLFSTYNYVQMNQYEGGTYYRIMIKMSHPLVVGTETYDRIYSNIVRCGGSDPVDPPVMADESNLSNISAYPNPFGDAITIEFESNGFDNVEYEVVNAIGQIVVEDKNATSPIVIGSELERGFYIVRLRSGDEVYNLKISKQ